MNFKHEPHRRRNAALTAPRSRTILRLCSTRKKTVTLQGTVKEFEWTTRTPGFASMSREKTGKALLWALELSSPHASSPWA